MGLFGWVKEKAQKAWTAVKEGAAYVAEKVKEGVDYAARKLHDWSDKAKDYIGEKRLEIAQWHEEKARKLREDKYRIEVIRGKHKLKEEKPDVELENKCVNYLKEKFPKGIKKEMHRKSEVERVETIVEIVNDVSEIMGVDVKLELDIPQRRADMKYYGSYNRTTNELHINMGYLTCDKPELVAEQVYTVFHELNHARQWAIVKGEKDYGYSDERKMELALNFLYYIRPEVSDYAYVRQPLEANSFGLEEKLKEAMSGLE